VVNQQTAAFTTKNYVVCVDHTAVTPKEAQDFIDEHSNHGVTITVERWDWVKKTKVGQVPKPKKQTARFDNTFILDVLNVPFIFCYF